MANLPHNLDGQRYGSLLVLRFIGGGRGQREVRCDCGRIFVITMPNLLRRQTQCRGCLVFGNRQSSATTAADLVLRAMLDAGPGIVSDLAKRAGVSVNAAGEALRRLEGRRAVRVVGCARGRQNQRIRVFGAVMRAAR